MSKPSPTPQPTASRSPSPNRRASARANGPSPPPILTALRIAKKKSEKPSKPLVLNEASGATGARPFVFVDPSANLPDELKFEWEKQLGQEDENGQNRVPYYMQGDQSLYSAELVKQRK